ncbi:respiratory nitrate reductase chaperone NarJ [Streptoalloteichus tenebrarius]|uniref:Respiratory nitrate reductase chaperone NarJ n=1 Tax=Streptoalloteichus tenebrarius (strain ATCC 17920 / DSM 40477 / JCM 4838 / CBS 697.72 / NBRC 16177 / NCIMB 11028 / NRRL B-12390 / A12253. 1 / ISP 5477) TaxID=1933 RepID=A0ABT1HRT2_STRSD|nr:nitrate reductase molybdenum cofactor assembly chaperone [Streptoalloteichus tenebrarius]MCP2258224.1 respiratory nitrate reductase chaperone NarJ [Streptoalloteichus tenebrarius]BFF04546.1 nitrate reductase molybdenum cofactor assembly chaperone [Streptoalloteichus tenebrarius]
MSWWGRRAEERSRHQVSVVRQAAAWCLHYPDSLLVERIPLLRSALSELDPSEPVSALLGVVEHLASTPQADAARHYVEVFDSRPRLCLYLTWYTDGDTRRRGGSLSEFKQLYREHGFVPSGGELPDYLPMLLEFTATGGPPARQAGEAMLARYRPAMELLADNLARCGTPYVHCVRAVVGTTPPTGAGGRDASPAPPSELVGLDLPGFGRPGSAPHPPEGSR